MGRITPHYLPSKCIYFRQVAQYRCILSSYVGYIHVYKYGPDNSPTELYTRIYVMYIWGFERHLQRHGPETENFFHPRSKAEDEKKSQVEGPYRRIWPKKTP